MGRCIPLLLCIFFLFSGCQAAPLSQKELLLAFQCRAEIQYGDETFDCALNRQGPGVVSYRMEGLGYHWKGDGFSQTCAGLEAEEGACPLPRQNFAVQVNRFLDALHREGALQPLSNGELEGSLEGESFTVKADPASGRLEELRVPQLSLTVRFYAYEG